MVRKKKLIAFSLLAIWILVAPITSCKAASWTESYLPNSASNVSCIAYASRVKTQDGSGAYVELYVNYGTFSATSWIDAVTTEEYIQYVKVYVLAKSNWGAMSPAKFKAQVKIGGTSYGWTSWSSTYTGAWEWRDRTCTVGADGYPRYVTVEVQFYHSLAEWTWIDAIEVQFYY